MTMTMIADVLMYLISYWLDIGWLLLRYWLVVGELLVSCWSVIGELLGSIVIVSDQRRTLYTKSDWSCLGIL